MAHLVKNALAMQKTWVGTPGWDDPLEKGKGYQLQYSGLENSMDCVIHGVAKTRTQLSDFHFHFTFLYHLSFQGSLRRNHSAMCVDIEVVPDVEEPCIFK